MTMTRKELQAIGIAAMEYQLTIHKPNEIMFRSPQPDKNVWTYQEYYEGMVNDTPLENRQFDFQELDKGEQFEIAVEKIGFERFKSMLEKCIEEAESYAF